ncbi:LLM class flavin-dependent oxidoreductase [Nocardiopsis sp. B62]|uniref:LLM class flavin-dependent oxidoreductase n=1 Tax=Nocardiopsis sp. B62 TaxID=2824874 RepID=UPI001B358A4A|nr:LLM class flavin-dependent oxidoreductase [Nocardiopsis sp. B62]MBQ1079939.1 LLM class flavin-dependent oxidoreductase [Nocardiopsis sp. B62]
MSRPLSVLDLAPIQPGQNVADSFAASVALARQAENSGYTRLWYAEHHSIAAIASSATAVLIAHMATQTTHIRLGAGGIMLPNHSPLVIAEQFATLQALHPGRIDLGLGRAAGASPRVLKALRRSRASADRFPQDVQELQRLLGDAPLPDDAHAIPGAGSHVPLFILGSSLFGAQLAAKLGLPYAFASHFAPDMLEQAAHTYRQGFRPSADLAEPYLIVGANVVASDTADAAHQAFLSIRRTAAAGMVRPGASLDDKSADELLSGPVGAQIDRLMHYTAVGDAVEVARYLDDLAHAVGADEVITAHQMPDLGDRLRSVALTATASGITPKDRQEHNARQKRV